MMNVSRSRFIVSTFLGLLLLLGTSNIAKSDVFPTKEACEASCQNRRNNGYWCVCRLIKESSKTKSLSPTTSDLVNSSEKLGGHTLERHVSKSNEYLIRRANQGDRKNDKGKPASTFYDRATADKAILENMQQNGKEIIKWMIGSDSKPKYFKATHQYPIGRGVKKGRKRVTDNIRESTILLVKDSRTPYGFRVDTAYPELDP